jgi:hypothetical protein
MSTSEKNEYPPCPKRLTGADMHPKCNDPMKGYFQRPVRETECRRCLGLDPMPTDAATDESSPPDPPLAPMQPSPPSDPPTSPGLVRQAISYTEALARWTAAGRPERSDKDVERIFHEHCKPCKWYDPKKHICRGCGCRVADSGVAVLNKIRMATEHCPRDLW